MLMMKTAQTTYPMESESVYHRDTHTSVPTAALHISYAMEQTWMAISRGIDRVFQAFVGKCMQMEIIIISN